MRAYVLGNENCVLGFALVGIEGQIVRSEKALDEGLDTYLADHTIGLVLVSSDAADLNRERVDRLKVVSATPLVVEIPGQGEGSAYPSLKDLVQRAVGISLGGE